MSYSAAPPSYAPNEKQQPYPTAPAAASAPYPQQPQAQQPVIINVNNSPHQPLLQSGRYSYSAQEQGDALEGLEPFISAPSCKITVAQNETSTNCKVVVNSTIHSSDRCTLSGSYSTSAFHTFAQVATLGASNKRVSLTLNSANVNGLIKIQRFYRVGKSNKFVVKSKHNNSEILGHIRPIFGMQTAYTIQSAGAEQPQIRFQVSGFKFACWSRKIDIIDMANDTTVGALDEAGQLSFHRDFPRDSNLRALTMCTALLYKLL